TQQPRDVSGRGQEGKGRPRIRPTSPSPLQHDPETWPAEGSNSPELTPGRLETRQRGVSKVWELVLASPKRPENWLTWPVETSDFLIHTRVSVLRQPSRTSSQGTDGFEIRRPVRGLV